MSLLKRILPILVPVLAVTGYLAWDHVHTAQMAAEQEKLALVTAQVWVATALYRNDPEKYLAYRDSVLNANAVDREQIFTFLDNRESQAEELLPFAKRVHQLVDSLAILQDSIARDERFRPADSVRAAVQKTDES